MNEKLVDVKLTTEEQDQLVGAFVEYTMLSVSKEQFDEVLEKTGDTKEALYAAVLNDAINAVLADHMKDIEETE